MNDVAIKENDAIAKLSEVKNQFSADKPLMQIRSRFCAAMKVPVPRDDEKVLANIKKIAERRGNSFYYLWPVKDKGEVKFIKGGTIDLAETILYYWTNIALEHDVEDLGDRWKIKHILIDFERGLQVPHTTVVHKPTKVPGGWEKARWERMNLNKANSYNLRDLIFTVIPRFMRDEIIKVAMRAEADKAKKEFDTEEMSLMLLQIREKYNLTSQDLYAFLGVKKIDLESYIKIKNIYAQLERGDVTVKNIIDTNKSNEPKEDRTRTKSGPKNGSKTKKEETNPTPDEATAREKNAQEIPQGKETAVNDNNNIHKKENGHSSTKPPFTGIITDEQDMSKEEHNYIKFRELVEADPQFSIKDVIMNLGINKINDIPSAMISSFLEDWNSFVNNILECKNKK